MSVDRKALAKNLRAAIRIVGDANNWITLSNGNKVELNEEGEVQKGMGGQQKGVNIKQAAKNMSEQSKTDKSNSGSGYKTAKQKKEAAAANRAAAVPGSAASMKQGSAKTAAQRAEKNGTTAEAEFNKLFTTPESRNSPGGKAARKELEAAGHKFGGQAEPAQAAKPSNPRHGTEAKTPSGIDKSKLEMRDRNAIGNAGKFNSRANAESSRDKQKYNTNILQGEGGQFWVPATNREESILKRLGYQEADKPASNTGSRLQQAETEANAKSAAAKAATAASEVHGYSPKNLAGSLGITKAEASKQLKQAAEALKASGKSGEAAMTEQLKSQNKGYEHLIKSDSSRASNISSILSKVKW